MQSGSGGQEQISSATSIREDLAQFLCKLIKRDLQPWVVLNSLATDLREAKYKFAISVSGKVSPTIGRERKDTQSRRWQRV